MMKEQEYGAGYRYDHDEPEAFSGQNYFPAEMGREQYYNPPERGFRARGEEAVWTTGQRCGPVRA